MQGRAGCLSQHARRAPPRAAPSAPSTTKAGPRPALAEAAAVTAARSDGERAARLALAGRRLDALSPLSVLDRGYAIALNEAGEAVKDAETLKPGDKLSLRLARGTRQVIVDDSA